MGFAGFVLRIYMHIRQGQGSDTYDTVYGFHISWGQAAGMFASVALMMLVAYLLRWWQLWRRSRQEGAPVDTILKDLKRQP
jgi:hypothetical protein